jgi:hypothetical protein
MENNDNVIEPSSEYTESHTKNTVDLAIEDGTYYSLEQVKELLPFGLDVMHKILYLQLNDKILSKDEKDILDLEIKRMKQANSARLQPDLKKLNENKDNENDDLKEIKI